MGIFSKEYAKYTTAEIDSNEGAGKAKRDCDFVKICTLTSFPFPHVLGSTRGAVSYY